MTDFEAVVVKAIFAIAAERTGRVDMAADMWNQIIAASDAINDTIDHDMASPLAKK